MPSESLNGDCEEELTGTSPESGRRDLGDRMVLKNSSKCDSGSNAGARTSPVVAISGKSSAGSVQSGGSPAKDGEPTSAPTPSPAADDDCVLINVSPIGPGHCLLVPRLGQLQPQRLDSHGLQTLLDVLLVSRSPGLRGLFNSLGALASVNHYHLQLYYFPHPLYIESAAVERLAQDLYWLVDYPAPAFVVEVTRRTYPSVASRVVALAELLLDRGLAFNLVVSRGQLCSADPPPTPAPDQRAEGSRYPALRLFLWPRPPELPPVPREDYQLASCEFAGHIAVTSPEALATLTEESIAGDLASVAGAAFHRVRPAAVQLWNRLSKTVG